MQDSKPFHVLLEAKKPSASPEPERKFTKPSEMKKAHGSQFGSPSSHVSNGPMANKPPVVPPTSESKPPTHSNKPAAVKAAKPPPPAPKTARISDLMKRFEKSPGPDQSSPSKSPSPQHEVVSPTHMSNSLGPPKRVDPDVSPVSGRKFNKKESLGDLKKKFEEGSSGGFSDRSVSPSSREGSRGTSPDGGKPFLPPKPGGSGGSHHGSSNAPPPPWLKNKIPEEKPPRSFGRTPSPHHDHPPPPKPAVSAPESSPGLNRSLPPRKRDPPKPSVMEHQPSPRNSPKVSRRFPPPTSPAPPEPPAESEKIEEEDASDAKQAFVYRWVFCDSSVVVWLFQWCV